MGKSGIKKVRKVFEVEKFVSEKFENMGHWDLESCRYFDKRSLYLKFKTLSDTFAHLQWPYGNLEFFLCPKSNSTHH